MVIIIKEISYKNQAHKRKKSKPTFFSFFFFFFFPCLPILCLVCSVLLFVDYVFHTSVRVIVSSLMCSHLVSRYIKKKKNPCQIQQMNTNNVRVLTCRSQRKLDLGPGARCPGLHPEHSRHRRPDPRGLPEEEAPQAAARHIHRGERDGGDEQHR